MVAPDGYGTKHCIMTKGSDRKKQNKHRQGTGLRQALGWATQLSGVSLELATCLLVGYWGDQYWGTKPWLLILGGILGFIISMWHLWRIVQAIERSSDSSKRKLR